jgi:very-short-patch-repair endonuclease
VALPKPPRARPPRPDAPTWRDAVRATGWLPLLGAIAATVALAWYGVSFAPVPAALYVLAVAARYVLLRRAAPRALVGAVPELRPRPRMSVREELGKRGGHVTMNREVVRSKPELRIANFLFKRGVRYLYEPQLEGATPDFYLPDSNVVLEHWGMEHTRYRRRRAEKTAMYKSRGYLVVETEKIDVPRLERVLEQRLLKADPRVFSRKP